MLSGSTNGYDNMCYCLCSLRSPIAPGFSHQFLPCFPCHPSLSFTSLSSLPLILVIRDDTNKKLTELKFKEYLTCYICWYIILTLVIRSSSDRFKIYLFRTHCSVNVASTIKIECIQFSGIWKGRAVTHSTERFHCNKHISVHTRSLSAVHVD